VENAEYLLHEKGDNIAYINGNFSEINLKSTEPVIKEKQALTKALKYVNAEKYKWEDPDMEKFVKQHRNNANATYYPNGELVIAKDYLQKSNSFYLAWKFVISSLRPENEQIIIVNAINGEIIQDVPLIIDANTSGTAQTLYSSSQNITCDSYSNEYRLYETRNTTTGNNVIIHTKNCLNQTDIANAIEFSNTGVNWTSGNWADFNQDQAALDAHWGAEKVIDYWKTIHNRNSLNDSGLNIISYVHYPYGVNAAWNSTDKVMRYGDGGSGITPLTSIDIIAHEMGHGITQFTSNLAYVYDESGALNEGFSDIWGACLKNYVDPSKQIWLCGDEVFQNYPNYNCIRNISNPKSSLAYEGCHPTKYQGQCWSGYSEMHCNSTVLSYWFYLISQGGSGYNEGIPCNVTGIGINEAQHIAYRTLLDLYPSANYSAARNASIQAAINLYGTCSQEVVDVTNAWYAVGVGGPFMPMPVNFTNQIIDTNTTVTSNCSNIIVQYVEVRNGAKLILEAFEDVDIVSDFEVKLGSEFEIVYP